MYSSASNQLNNLFVSENAEMDQLNHPRGNKSHVIVPRNAFKTHAMTMSKIFLKALEESIDCIETFYRASQPVCYVQAPSNANTARSNFVNVSNALEERRSSNESIPFYIPITDGSKNCGISKHNSRVMVIELYCEELVNDTINFCDRKFSDMAKLKEHLSKEHGIKPYQCFSRGCDKVSFNKYVLLNKHVKDVHNNNMQCKVLRCEKTFKSAVGLELHYEKEHLKGIYQCIKCRTCYRYISDFKKHKICPKNNQQSNNFIPQIRNMRSN